MICFPNCKINIGLEVLGKRADGFHDIATVFFPIAQKDVLEAVRSNAPQWSASGFAVGGNWQDNLVAKAYSLLQQDFPNLSPVHWHLHKAIPMGAGLGGGSADGAFALRLLNKLFQLQLSDEQLMHYALQLGSDCPFFVLNQPAFATGRGEALQPLSIDLSAYNIVLINPGIHVNTGWAFQQMNLPVGSNRASKLKTAIEKPIKHWPAHIHNDFEQVVFAAHPAIQELKEKLYANDAAFAAMTGTGSTVYGLFEKAQHASSTNHHFLQSLNLPNNYWATILPGTCN
jgi:4-diphosphocytidyl-2-C-methyl-D-erythritol kinase